MTLPDERYKAVLYTQQFLIDLLNPKTSPGVPREIRQRASALLKHYPNGLDMERTSEKIPEVFAKDWTTRKINYE